MAPPVTFGVTYQETRFWAVTLRVFTVSDLADIMAVPEEALDSFVFGLLFNGTIEDTGDRINGRGSGIEEVYAWIPLPAGPKEHETGPTPESIAVMEMGGFEVLSPRGGPVRIRTERQMRRSLSTPGARQTHKLRELAYQRQEEARQKRAEEQRLKGSKKPKWMIEKEAGRARAIQREKEKNRLLRINNENGNAQ
jgi:hypothetical protein